jgi:hypothetical protein
LVSRPQLDNEGGLAALAENLAGVPDEERARIAGSNTARVHDFDVARLTVHCLNNQPLYGSLLLVSLLPCAIGGELEGSSGCEGAWPLTGSS